MTDLRTWLNTAVDAVAAWQDTYGPYQPHPSLNVDPATLASSFDELATRLRNNYPFFHPNYAGQILKPPHDVAVIGYLAAMLVNPNNHAQDGGPATAVMEREVVTELAGMFGFDLHLGHLTSSGTIANLEALFVARESHPGKGIAYSADSHYTHARMCGVLGIAGHEVAVDAYGRMDLDALEDLLRTERIGTVVLTAGTTGLGAVDQIHEALDLKERYGVRIHVDAAYGGFFALLADQSPELVQPEPWRAIKACDSVVIDPHKHGLQPYGCGAVIFADPAVGQFYRHDSPYTYFTDAEFHLGEISLECSRAGASAAALWLTLRMFPLTGDGLGAVIAACRRAALRFAKLIENSDRLRLYQHPELDIVSYFPVTEPPSLSLIDAASARLMTDGMTAEQDPVFLSVFRTTADAFARRQPGVTVDSDGARVLRSVLLKPEFETTVDQLLARLETLAGGDISK